MKELDHSDLCLDFGSIEAEKVTEAVAFLSTHRAQIRADLESRTLQMIAERVDGSEMVRDALKQGGDYGG